MDRLESALGAVIEMAPPTEATVKAATERIFAALGEAGHARLLAWRALERGGPEPGEDEPVLRRLTDLVHARRLAVHGGKASAAISREDSEFFMWLTASATLGDAIFGPFIDGWIGRKDASGTRERYRARFGQLLFERLLPMDSGDDPQRTKGRRRA